MSGEKRWIAFPGEQCDNHGADVEIFTAAEQTIPGSVHAYDGDDCRCSEGCKGSMSIDEDSFYCKWDEDDAESGKGGAV
jgi:hypothetical protein